MALKPFLYEFQRDSMFSPSSTREYYRLYPFGAFSCPIDYYDLCWLLKNPNSWVSRSPSVRWISLCLSLLHLLFRYWIL